MFIRTRETEGFIFYLGSDLGTYQNTQQVLNRASEASTGSSVSPPSSLSSLGISSGPTIGQEGSSVEPEGNNELPQPLPLAASPTTSASIRSRRSSYITCELSQGNLVVRVLFDGTGNGAASVPGSVSGGRGDSKAAEKTEKFQVYTVNLADGYRHFIRVRRRNKSMKIAVNDTVSISHDFPDPIFFVAEKLYLGNFPDARLVTPISTTTTQSPRMREELFEFADGRSVDEVSERTSTTTLPSTIIDAGTSGSPKSFDNEIASVASSPTTLLASSSNVGMSSQAGVDEMPDNRGGSGMDEETTTSAPLLSNGSPSASSEVVDVTTFADPDSLPTTTVSAPPETSTISVLSQPEMTTTLESVEFLENEADGAEETTTTTATTTTTVIGQRTRRDIEGDTNPTKKAPKAFQSSSPKRFKGVIQDVQISDGKKVTTIVEFFSQDFGNVSVVKPPSIGQVTLLEVEEGVVSDDTCSQDPCLNGGACQVTWNDYV